MEKSADLHVHTTASDGALTPTEAVQEARRVRLASIGITDHDSVDGIGEALVASKIYGVDVVPGVEISALHDGTEVHILGYFVDHEHPELLKEMCALKEARIERASLMVKKLNSMGVPIDLDRVFEIARSGSVGRPHVAQAIYELGLAPSVEAAFGRFLYDGGPAYVPRLEIQAVRAIELIKNAGGVPCLAHVAKLRRDDLIIELLKAGIAGIEVYHPDHPTAASRFHRRFAERHGLLVVGGSDAHCLPHSRAGGIGSITVAYDVVEQLRALARNKRI
ncbi:MAG: PHP domain-containing protein [Armatimonadota bacterium]